MMGKRRSDHEMTMERAGLTEARPYEQYSEGELIDIDLAVAEGETQADRGEGRLVSDILAELQAKHAARG